MSTVGFVGAGAMGAPMVARLLAAGHEVHLHARRTEVRDRFAALGAHDATTPAVLAGAADLIVACPFAEAQLVEIVQAVLPHAAPGTVLVGHATVSVAGIRRLAEEAAPRGVTVLDAPVSGTADDVAAGRLTVLLGGDDAAAERATGALEAYAGSVVRTGAVGSATAVKLVNNLVFAAHVQVACAAVELGRALDVAEPDLLAALGECSARSFALSTLRAVGDVGTFTTRAAPYLRKDVAVVTDALLALGQDTGLLGRVVRDGPADLGGRS